MNKRVPGDLESSAEEVAAGLLHRDGLYLLCRRTSQRTNFPGLWDLPGGHVEPGERPSDALVRELREELGIVVEAPAGEPAVLLRPAAGVVVSVWLIDEWQGDVVNAAPAEHDAFGWFAEQDIARLAVANPSLVDLCTRHRSAGRSDAALHAARPRGGPPRGLLGHDGAHGLTVAAGDSVAGGQRRVVGGACGCEGSSGSAG